jgi:DNA-binding MarR family transcriptional regulator
MKFYFVQRRHLPTWGEEVGLSHVQCQLLHLIEPEQPVPMRRLATLLACDASNVTGLVDRLESRGLVARQASPQDRRVKVIALTATGARLRAQLLQHVTARPLPLSALTPDERRTLVRILERLVDEQND